MSRLRHSLADASVRANTVLGSWARIPGLVSEGDLLNHIKGGGGNGPPPGGNGPAAATASVLSSSGISTKARTFKAGPSRTSSASTVAVATKKKNAKGKGKASEPEVVEIESDSE